MNEIRKFFDDQYEEFEKNKDTTLVSKFESITKKYGNNFAVFCKDSKISYSELNEKANQIAWEILKKTENLDSGCYPIEKMCNAKRRVFPCALLFKQEIDIVLSILGSLKSGNPYTCIDVDYPLDRIGFIVNDCEVALVLTNNNNIELAEKLKTQNNKLIILNIDNLSQNRRKENLKLRIKPTDPAYLIYTSGSTGKPKGVVQNHKNVIHFIEAYSNNLRLDSNDRLLQVSSFCFDAAVMDLYGSLLNGSTLYLYDIKSQSIGTSFLKWIKKNGITVYHSTPTVYRLLFKSLTEMISLESIRLAVLGGEKVTIEDVEIYKRVFHNNCILVNGLGPTESTVTLQYFIHKKTCFINDKIPVGFPVCETEVYIIKENGEKAGVYEEGEIVFESEFLALGYLNLPDKTNEKFKNNDNNKLRLYYTGDFGEFNPDGSIVFTERKDFQVKIRGHRIELSEIEQAIYSIGLFNKVIVNVCGENDMLIAYYQSKDGIKLNFTQIKNKLSDRLPSYMIPNAFMYLKKIPMTPSGKINKRELPSPTAEILLESKSIDEVNNELNEYEKIMLNVWREKFDNKVIEIDDNFFSIGGHSLKAIEIVEKAEKEGIYLSISDIFKYRTIRSLIKNMPIQKNDYSFGKTLNQLIDIKELEKNYREEYKNRLKIELPMIDQIDVATYLCRFIPVSIIQSYDNLKHLYNTHLVNVCSQISVEGYTILDYLEPYEIFGDAIEYEYKGYNEILEKDDVVGYIINLILSGKYVSICLDEFYLSVKADFQKKHFVHESLVYGFDIEKEIFLAVGIDKEKMMRKISFKFNMLSKAFREGFKNYRENAWYAQNQALTIMMPNRLNNYEFDYEEFMSNLSDYIYGLGNRDRVYMITPVFEKEFDVNFVEKELKVKYGIDVYEDILFALNQIIEGNKKIDYRAFHFIAEHKRVISQKMKYIRVKHLLGSNFKKFEERLDDIIEKTERARLLFLELENVYETCPKDEKETICLKMIAIFKEVKQQEFELFKSVLKYYDHHFKFLNERDDEYLFF